MAKPTAKKKTAPKKTAKVAPKSASKKVAMKVKKPAAKELKSKTASKPVKVPAKTDVKKPTMSKAAQAAALKATAKTAAKAPAKPEVKLEKGGKKVELKVKAAATVPMSAKQLAKAAKAAAAASKPYESDACREVACESLQTTAGYCRLHYIKNWKKIKRKELILREKKLNQYIEELVAKYPDKYIEAIKQDLADEKAFAKVIYDLELDESVDDIDLGEDNDEEVIENIKRGGFDDSGDADF